MTELMLAAEQTGRFHETKYADQRTRILADEWRELTCLLPATVANSFGLTTYEEQIAQFATPADRRVAYAPGDPRLFLSSIFARLNRETGWERMRTAERASLLLHDTARRQVDAMRHNWQAGYFPRMRPVRIDGDLYDIYNHVPAFQFTGEVVEGKGFNFRTQEYEPYLYAEFDMEPLRDEAGEYIPNDPDVPVVILPAMEMEPYVGRALVVAHLQALRASLSPDIVKGFAEGLPRVLEEERIEANGKQKHPWGASAMAELAIARMF